MSFIRDKAVLLAVGVLVVDLLSKAWAFSAVPEGSREQVGLGLSVETTRNEGIAFSMLEGKSWLIFLLTAAAITLLVAYYTRHRARRGLWIATGLMLGGALGNAIDRVRLGYVRDFITLPSWPTFNVADIALTLGVIVLVLTYQSDATDAD